METSSSVYMCFPCYQEFETLDEVLKHQLTCNAEATEPAPIIPGTTSITVPLPQAQQQLVGQLVSPSRAVLTQQTKAEDTAVWPLKDATVQIESIKGSFSMSDQPRILYQCGDCNELFKSLDLWQEHRKEGSCQQPSSVQNTDDYPDNQPEADPEPQPESYCVQETAPEPEPEDSGSSKETFSENQDSIPLKEVTSSQVVTENQANVSSAENSGLPAAESINLVQDDSSPSRKRGANKKPKPEPVFLCVNCGSCFGLVSELVAHRKTQHGLEEALHRCSVCGECFLNTTLFLYHRKQHRQKGEERREATENVTETSEKVTETLERACAPEQDAEEKDVMIATPSSGTIFVQPELFMCIRCGESFSNGEGLAAHREGRHDLQAALHRCNTCGQDFMNTTQYLYHRRLHRSQAVTEDGEEAATEVDGGSGSTEDTQQTQKRPHSPPATSSDPDFPRPKRGRPAIRILSNSSSTKAKKGTGPGGISMEANSTATDSEATNQPPPAKLLQDWARTPLPHVCPYCGKTFTRRVFLRTHVFSHTGEKLFTCKVCSKCFTNSQSLLRHSMCHTGNKPYVCDVCGKKFSQVCTLKRHQGTHSSTQPRRKRGRKPICGVDDDGTAHVFSCPHCTARFNTEDQLKHHILLHSSHPFPCPECGEAFKRRKELDLHSLSHQDKEPVTCPHCSAQFINQSVLDIHLQRCPTSEEDKNVGRGRGQGRGRCTGQIECDLCGHRCMTQEGLDLHRLSHTGQTPLKCPVMSCRRRFASNGALEEHVVAHIQGTLTKAKHRPRFRCEICLKDFAYTSTFNVHMRTHTDERPFACATCGKRFRQLPHLQDHERIHSGLRPFCCWVCGKSFSVAARLTEHARTHSGEKPYVCGYCPAAFRSRSNLDKHARLHGELSQEDGEQHAAQVQQVLKGAKVLTSLAAAVEGEPGSVQTIYVLQEEDGDCGGTETVMISAEQLAAVDGSSQMVILPSSVLGGQTITVPTISMDGGEIMMQTNTSPHHTIEFIVEETVV